MYQSGDQQWLLSSVLYSTEQGMLLYPIHISEKKNLKAQYWPLCFGCLCCCFGFHRSEASIVIKEFYSGHKQISLRIFYITKMAAKRSQHAMLNGQYRVFNTWYGIHQQWSGTTNWLQRWGKMQSCWTVIPDSPGLQDPVFPLQSLLRYSTSPRASAIKIDFWILIV